MSWKALKRYRNFFYIKNMYHRHKTTLVPISFLHASFLIHNFIFFFDILLWQTILFWLSFEINFVVQKLLHHKPSGPPRWNSHCRGEGAYPPKRFTKVRQVLKSSTAATVRSKDLLNCNVKTWVNTDKTRLERSSLVDAPFSV